MLHIRDCEFIRGKAPMTKEEIRVVSISKLALKKDSVLIDVGAGTGSIGIEASRYLDNGKVIGIECEEDALFLIEQNLQKFQIKNYELISGYAPEKLPSHSFDRMFIGGSKGNLRPIFEYFNRYASDDARLVINAIVIETLTESLALMKEYGFEEIEITSLNVSKNKSIGQLNMMMAENPIFILNAKKGKKDV